MILDDFQKNVIYIVAALFLVALIIFGIIIYKKRKTAAKETMKKINCPDYWEDLSEGDGSNCVNVKNLGTCGSNSMDFTTKQWLGDKGLCNKNEWAKKCDLTWDGITNNQSISCKENPDEFKPLNISVQEPAPEPPEDKYFMYGPWIAYNKEFKPVSKTEHILNNTYYMIEDGVYTKIVDKNGVAKYYEGKMSEFDLNKWNSSKNAEGNYILRQCPHTCNTGCSISRECSSSPEQAPVSSFALNNYQMMGGINDYCRSTGNKIPPGAATGQGKTQKNGSIHTLESCAKTCDDSNQKCTGFDLMDDGSCWNWNMTHKYLYEPQRGISSNKGCWVKKSLS